MGTMEPVLLWFVVCGLRSAGSGAGVDTALEITVALYADRSSVWSFRKILHTVSSLFIVRTTSVYRRTS